MPVSIYYAGLLGGIPPAELRRTIPAAGYFRRLAVFGTPENENPLIFGQVLGFWPEVSHVGLYRDRTFPAPVATTPLAQTHSLVYGDTLLFAPGSLSYVDGSLSVLEAPVLRRAGSSTYRLPYRPYRHAKIHVHGAPGGSMEQTH